MPILSFVEASDNKLWKSVTNSTEGPLTDLLPPSKTRLVRNHGHSYVLLQIRTERFKCCFIYLNVNMKSWTFVIGINRELIYVLTYTYEYRGLTIFFSIRKPKKTTRHYYHHKLGLPVFIPKYRCKITSRNRELSMWITFFCIE